MADTVVIQREEYERLIEAAEELSDLRAYDNAMAELAAGDDERVPADFARRLVTGESPVRVYRELRRLTQHQLSTAAGVNRVQIAEIEAGRKSGSIETVKKLAQALGVTVDDLI